MLTQKLKDILCSSAKDKVLDTDNAEVIYKVDMECDTESGPREENYVEETKKGNEEN